MRRWFITLGSLFAAGLVALLALPWWLGPVARLVAHRYHAEFSRYERLGYGRFALHDVRVAAPAGVQVEARRVETETPVRWAWHHWTGRDAAITVGGWSVTVAPRSGPAPESKTGGARRTREILFKVAAGLERWAPRTDVAAGRVTWPGGGLELAAARWRTRTLSVDGLQVGGQTGAVAATFATDGRLQVSAHPLAAPWEVELTGTEADLAGTITLWNQRATLAAHLPVTGWMPESAELTATGWTLPAEKLSLGAGYAVVRGDGRVSWREGRFETSLAFAGEARPQSPAPPLNARVHATGDRSAVTVDLLVIDVPGLAASLDQPVVLDYQGRPRGGSAQLSLRAELDKLPWLTAAQGHVTGTATWRPTDEGWARIEGTLAAQDMKAGRWAMARLAAGWLLDWPKFQVRDVAVSLAEGGELKGGATLDLATKTLVEAEADGAIKPSLIAPWLPGSTDFDSLTLSARAHGPLASIEHGGQAHAAGLRFGRFQPLDLQVSWHGTGRALEIPAAEIRAGDSRIMVAGSLDQSSAQLSVLRFMQGQLERLALTHPVAVQWSPALAVSGLDLQGPDTGLTLAGRAGPAGQFKVTARNFSSGWLKDFIRLPGPRWELATLEADGHWDGGPLAFAVRSQWSVTLASDRAANVTLTARGGKDGVALEALRIAEGEQAIVTATGQIPLTIYPAGPSRLQIEPEAALAIDATTTPNPAFWRALAAATGLEFEQPEVSLKLAGTWAHPRGELSAKATRLAADPQRIKWPFPSITALDAHATADSRKLVLDRLAARVEGQEIRLSGELPVTREQWADLHEAPLAFLEREGSLRVEVPGAEVAAIARFFPRYLAPEGRLKIDARLERGGEMNGSIELHDAATRPFGPLGVLQNLEADLRLEGRGLRIVRMTAETGGQPVTIAGTMAEPLGARPRVDLTLKGQNLPLVRQAGLLVRADLDLKLATPADQPTAVTGAVKLRESMFLTDVRAFIPKGGASDPARRPPYFAITVPPLDTWRLNVDVRGEKFLRIRTPLFIGVASAHFRLGGTLAEPRAVGEAVIDSGQVMLPFANFRVDQGAVRLTEADPYALRLNMTGSSRRYGYDLRMEMTGTASDPVVTFSSSPPLETSQVLLMVTAGEVPQDEITYGANQRVARLGTYLGQSLINDFGGDATEADRLSISTGERVSRQGRETYDIEYRVNDRLTLVGEYDEFDDYNAGVKWRLFAPKETPAPPPAAAAPLQTTEANDAPRR